MSGIKSMGFDANPYDVILYDALKVAQEALTLCFGSNGSSECETNVTLYAERIKKNCDMLKQLEDDEREVCYNTSYVSARDNCVSLNDAISGAVDHMFYGFLGTELCFTEDFERVFYSTDRFNRHKQLIAAVHDKYDNINDEFNFEGDVDLAEVVSLYRTYVCGAETKYDKKFNVWKNRYMMTVVDAEYIASYLKMCGDN